MIKGAIAADPKGDESAKDSTQFWLFEECIEHFPSRFATVLPHLQR
ncbi:unnamed protein product, partial [marine sediment metagenome]